MPSLHDPVIGILSKENQDSLRVAANLGARCLSHALENTKIGMSLDEVDKVVHDYIVADDAYPSAIGFMGFAKSVCLSVNDVVSHGVPNTYVLEDGDALNIDIVCYKEGHHGDNSAMIMLGDVDPEVQRLSKVAREAMYYAIEMCKPGVPFSQIGSVI